MRRKKRIGDKSKRYQRKIRRQVLIPQRANRVLNFILIALLLIGVRTWHLTVVQHEEHVQAARRPQRRAVVQRARRGTITDRYGIPLAVNQTQYNACVSYAQIRELPSVRWKKQPDGSRVKTRPRLEHVQVLAQLLSEKLGLDARRVEDEIHSHAALFPNVPYVIKADLTEQEYHRLRMLEKDWLGIHTDCVPRRSYPKGRVAADILGYMGAISREEYQQVAGEIECLKQFEAARADGEYAPLPKGFADAREVHRRLLDLSERAYHLRDQLGKAGVEGRFDEDLHGYCGKKTYQLDIYGSYIKEMPGGRLPLPGHSLQLTISSELQEFAEQLLIENEHIREGRSRKFDHDTRTYQKLKQPWIKGGAIVALDPNSGEVLALASYPRFDPNDFIASGDPDREEQRIATVLRWFETDKRIGKIWDGVQPLQRERWSRSQQVPYDEEKILTWESYLDFILPEHNEVREALVQLQTISAAIELQRLASEVFAAFPDHTPRDVMNALYQGPADVQFLTRVRSIPTDAPGFSQIADLRTQLDCYLSTLNYNYNKLLLIDLCQLIVDQRRFSSHLLAAKKDQSIPSFRQTNQAYCVLDQALRHMADTLFDEFHFSPWREEHQESFLKQKRREEQERGTYQRPYLDYLEQERKRKFTAFWEQHKNHLMIALMRPDLPPFEQETQPYVKHLAQWGREMQQGAHHHLEWFAAYQTLAESVQHLSPDLAVEYLHTMRSFTELERPLYGSYRYLRSEEQGQLEKHLALAFYPRYGFGYARSWAYRQAVPQGSIFKIVTAYTALVQEYQQRKQQGRSTYDLNPLTIIDQPHRSRGSKSGWNVGFTRHGEPIHELYKGGRLLRTHRLNIGEIGIVEALEVSSNSYFGLLTADYFDDPQDLNRCARSLGYGQRTGIELPGEYSGRLPTDLSTNRSGLYSYAVGQHTLVTTPLQTATMLASVANGGHTFRPRVIQSISGSAPLRNPDQLLSCRRYAFKEALDLIGVHFPLFIGADRLQRQHTYRSHFTEVVGQVDLPDAVRTTLLKGLQLAVNGSRGNGRPSAVRGYSDHPWMVRDYRNLAVQFVGKSATAEVVESVDLDPEEGTNIYNHIWFAGISFSPDQVSLPEESPYFGTPELVVVVHLRFGEYGREAGPVAAQIVKKWREIQQRHS